MYAILAGRVFDDLNGNNRFDTNETGHVGVTVFIDVNKNDALDQDEPVATTRSDDPNTTLVNEQGIYQFRQLPSPGPVAIHAVLPENFLPTLGRTISQILPASVDSVAREGTEIPSAGALELEPAFLMSRSISRGKSRS